MIPSTVAATTKKTMLIYTERKQIFDRLVGNALDFLDQSIKDLLEENTKYSVINFYTALELFLKARLMADHWSLVVTQVKEADWAKFTAGDFRSVTLKETVSRLRKIVGSELTEEEIQSFELVRTHRNKIVHFFHGHQEKDLATIAKQQLVAWHFLHGLLIRRWREHFDKWITKIQDIDRKLKEHRGFLQAVFDYKKREISRRQKDGSIFRVCASCTFKSQEHQQDMEEVYDAECLVCGLTEECLQLACNGCHNKVYFVNGGVSTCEKCGKQFDPQNLAEYLLGTGRALMVQDGEFSRELGNCGNCDGYHTIIKLVRESYFCVSCFTQFDYLTPCDYCQELHTGDMKDSYLLGCSQCDGCFEP